MSATILFAVVHGVVSWSLRRAQLPRLPLIRSYRTFLTLFWMTAPLAWLYAIPHERYATPVVAIMINLWTLGIVSIWRVLLITRVISVLYDLRPWAALFQVLFFADVLALVALFTVPLPIIDIMGGVRHAAREQLLAGVTFQTTLLAMLAAPITFGLWIVSCNEITGRAVNPQRAALSSTTSGVSRGLWTLASLSIVAWLPVLFFTQPEQQNRRYVERAMRRGAIAESLEYLSEREPTDFPPHWVLPPRLSYRESEPPLNEIGAAMLARWPADWVAERYLDKLHRSPHQLDRLDETDRQAIEAMLRERDSNTEERPFVQPEPGASQ